MSYGTILQESNTCLDLVPTKLCSPNSKQPWITTHIKRLSSQGAFNQACKNKSHATLVPKDNVNRSVILLIKLICVQPSGPEQESSNKKLWSYI